MHLSSHTCHGFGGKISSYTGPLVASHAVIIRHRQIRMVDFCNNLFMQILVSFALLTNILTVIFVESNLTWLGLFDLNQLYTQVKKIMTWVDLGQDKLYHSNLSNQLGVLFDRRSLPCVKFKVWIVFKCYNIPGAECNSR